MANDWNTAMQERLDRLRDELTAVIAARAAAITADVTAAVTAAVTPAVTASVTAAVTPAVTAAVTAAVTPAVTASVTAAVTPAVTASVTAAVTPEVTSAVTEAVTASVTTAFAEHAAALSRQADENMRRLTEAFRVGMEALHEHVRTAAETWGASIEALQRSLDEMNARLGGRLADHGAVLANHATRIEKLERRRGRA